MRLFDRRVGKLVDRPPITAGQDSEFIGEVVRDAVYFDFVDGHFDHCDEVARIVGLHD